MEHTKYSDRLGSLLQRPLFSAREARECGIPSRMLAYYHAQGRLERLSRGVYRSTTLPPSEGWESEDLALTAASIPEGVICLVSALSTHGLTEEFMREYWIAVPNHRRAPIRAKTRIVRMRNLSLGVEECELSGMRVRVTNRERTIVDAFRLLEKKLALEGLQAYLRESPNVDRLLDYARQLRVNLRPYVEALLL